jgi:hypothetical protein
MPNILDSLSHPSLEKATETMYQTAMTYPGCIFQARFYYTPEATWFVKNPIRLRRVINTSFMADTPKSTIDTTLKTLTASTEDAITWAIGPSLYDVDVCGSVMIGSAPGVFLLLPYYTQSMNIQSLSVFLFMFRSTLHRHCRENKQVLRQETAMRLYRCYALAVMCSARRRQRSMTTVSSTTLMDQQAWTGKIFNGDWIAPTGGGHYTVIEPATGDQIGIIGRASLDDVQRAADQAAEAQRAWARTSFNARSRILRRAGQLWEHHATEIGEWLIRESGSTPAKAAFEQHMTPIECYEAAAIATQPYGHLLRSEEPRLSFTRRLPVGVVGVITPFNSPLILSIRAVAPALALGNAVLLKPDPRTPIIGGVTLARIFQLAGLPLGVLHVLPGGPEIGEAVVSNAHVRVVSFTGSTRAGRAVGQLAASHLKRAHLELGGNSALIVLDDADLDRAVVAGAWGSFFHQGQIACPPAATWCMSGSLMPTSSAFLPSPNA